MTSDEVRDVTRFDQRKNEARVWFESLQQRLVGTIEAIERDFPGPFPDEATEPGRFAISPWARTDHSGAPGGGGKMAMLRGRVFEKIGAHTSTVFGTFAPEFAKQIPLTLHEIVRLLFSFVNGLQLREI